MYIYIYVYMYMYMYMYIYIYRLKRKYIFWLGSVSPHMMMNACVCKCRGPTYHQIIVIK